MPPYVVFSDATLRDMLLYRPRTLDELGRISGIGAVKRERYGDDILAVLAALCCSVIGGVISGSAQGLIIQKIMDEQTRKLFYATQVFIITIPYLLFIPLGAYIAQVLGMSADDVFAAYVKKNAVNFQRQESGYTVKDESDNKHI